MAAAILLSLLASPCQDPRDELGPDRVLILRAPREEIRHDRNALGLSPFGNELGLSRRGRFDDDVFLIPSRFDRREIPSLPVRRYLSPWRNQ